MADISREAGASLFGSDPSRYQAARPDYPPAIYQLLKQHAGWGPGVRTLEIGPGTGQATRHLLAAGVSRVVAVEADERLATYLRREVVPSAGGRLEVVARPFQDAELPSASFDLAIAATSFHWLEPGPALEKIHRLLAPGGRWAMWWNVFGDPLRPDAFQLATDPLFVGLDHSLSNARGGQPPFSLDAPARIAELTDAGFQLLAHEVIRWTRRFSTEQILALNATFSPVKRLPPERYQQFMERMRTIADRQFQGVVERTFLSTIYIAARD